MTKNISSKGHRSGNPKAAADKKSQQHANSNTTNNHSQSEVASSTVVISSVQKASIGLKMLTPEQRRLASLMNDKVDVSEIEKKINKIMELTGASKDKAIVALHDCANELDKAIDMILEGDSINESEWKSQARKKKPKAGSVSLTGGKESSAHLNGDAKKGSAGKGRQLRGKQANNQSQNDKPFSQNNRRNASDRSERRPRGEWKSKEQDNSADANDESSASNNNKATGEIDLDDKLDEWTDDTTTAVQSTRETRDRPRRDNDSQFSRPHNKYQNNTQEGRRINSGARGNYNRDRNRETSNQFGSGSDRRERREPNDRRTYQGKIFNAKKPGGYTNSIDTWSNLTAADNTSTNCYAQITVGNWSDVVSSNSAVVGTGQSKLNDDWVEPSENANLIDRATNKVVFNSSKDNNQANTVVSSTTKPNEQLSKMPNLASIVSGVKAVPQQQNVSNVHKPPSTQHQQANSKQQQQILSTSNNQSLLNKSSPQQQQQPQPQRQPSQPNQSQQSQNKIDLAALLKSSQQQQQSSNNLIRGNIQQQQRNNQSDSNAYGAAILQSLQQRVVNPDQDASSLGKSPSTNLNDYVNPYNQTANKNQVHNIPSTNYNAQQNAPPNLFDNQSHHSLHHQNVADQKLLIEKKRRQTKIPETAVEMPTSEHISSLNVQFGALDFSTAADSYSLNDDQITSKQAQFNLRESGNEKQNLNPTSLLGTVRGQQQSSESNKQQAKDSLLQNIDPHHHSSHHQLQDNILQQHNDSRVHNKHHSQQQSSGVSQLNTYNSNKNDTSNQHTSIYPPNLQNYQSSYGSVSNYGSQSHGNSSVSNAANATHGQNTGSNHQQQQQQKSINLRDLSDQSSSTNQNNNSSSTNNATSSNSSLGNLVNNTTVTTNVLKNSLTATGKSGGLTSSGNNIQQQLGVAPNVAAPLLGTPQYIMSQPGLSTAFYPVYDMPMAADHSFRYNQNTQDVKYNRTDAQDNQVGQSNHANPVQSTQAPVTQTPNHQIFSQFPPYFFYTGVNMMTQGLYQTPFLPVQPNPSAGNVNQPPHAPNSNQPHSTGFGPKGGQNQAYSAASYASSAYDPISAHQLTQGQDFNKQNYSSGPPNTNQNQQQTGKHSQHSQMSTGGSNDLVNNMYNKSHAQLTKNFDKPNAFQTGTPPPFGIATLGTLGYNPNPFIPMIQPQSNPSMLHHNLQGDASQNVNNSVAGGQRGGSQAQKNSASNAKNYYWSVN